MSAAPAITPRAHWHRRATELAVLDCHLLELLPWEEPALAKLPSPANQVLIRKLSEFVDWATEQAAAHRPAASIERSMAMAIWRFVKTLAPVLPVFGDY